MSAMDCYVFTSEPEGAAYAELVEFCCSVASKMILVVRDPEKDSGARIKEKLARLNEFHVEAVRAREWPGTILMGHDALVYSYRVAPGLQQVLQELATRLLEWLHPAAPEDLCFFRADGRVILVTTSHEGDAYLMLTEPEFQALKERAPHVVAILRLEGPAS
jgi:hypothetical protein